MASGVEAAIGSLEAAVDQLLDADFTLVAGTELAGLFARFERQRRRTEAVDHTIVAQLEDAQIAGEYGRTSTADLLVELTRLTPGEANARVRAARDLGPRREFNGAPLSPIFARVAEAQQAGSISAAHAKVITSTVAAIPAERSFELVDPVEQFLVEQAGHLDPKRLAAAARRLSATIDPDGAAPSEEEQQRRRDYAIAQQRNGFWEVGGCATDEYAAVWCPLIDALSAPQPSVDGMPDDRTPGQRRHDAMLEMGQQLLRSGVLPDCGGTPVTVALTVRADDLEQGSGIAVTECGPTDVDNLVLVCGWHHREFERRRWLVRMVDGVPEWIPPGFRHRGSTRPGPHGEIQRTTCPNSCSTHRHTSEVPSRRTGHGRRWVRSRRCADPKRSTVRRSGRPPSPAARRGARRHP